MDPFLIDEDLLNFIQAFYTIEQTDELLRSFELFHGFGLQYSESEFFNIMACHGQYDNSTLSDLFSREVRSQINRIFQEHSITINPEMELHTCNELLSGLLLIQCLDDYSEIAIVLESQMNHEEQFATVMSKITTLTEEQILEAVESISPSILKTLLAFCYEQEKTKFNLSPELITIKQKIIEKLKQFKVFMGEHTAVGYELIEHGVMIGQSLETYLPHITERLKQVNHLPQKALDILSVLMLTPEGYNLPLIAYRKSSNLLLDDLDTIQKIDVLITRILNDFELYKLQGA